VAGKTLEPARGGRGSVPAPVVVIVLRFSAPHLRPPPYRMLTDADLRRIIADGEKYDVEFKGEANRPLPDRELVEAVACQANGRGGVLLIGVEDDGRVTGAQPRHGTYTDPRRVEVLVANHTVPSCPIECTVFRLDEREVVAIEIPDGRPITATSAGVYARRATDVHGRPQCLPFLPHEMHSREATRGALDHTALIVPDARWEDIDPIEVERLRRTISKNPGRADSSLLALSDIEIVKALGLAEGRERIERVRVAGLLVLGREDALRRLVPTHEVAFQVLSGTRIAVNEFFRWPLLRVVEEVAARFDARNEEQEIEVGHIRAGIPAYSPAGFREALHNALVHRDYTTQGAVHVQWRDGEIEIASPGGFPAEIHLDNLLVAAPRPRNPVLADAFKRMGLVERTGRGIDTIFEGQLRYGRPAPDYSRTTAGAVQLVLKGGAPQPGLARFVIQHDVPGRRMTLEQMLLVNAIADESPIGIGRAATLIQRAEGPTRAVLDRMVEAGLLEVRQERREPVYQFSAATLRALGREEPGVRLAGASPVDWEKAILDYVAAEGRITRSQAADLCRLEPREARMVLERLVKRGELVVRGERRGSFYERATGIMAGRS
jgi:ATP-dependent DNA helicase RecG